jgi:hypothetical protein
MANQRRTARSNRLQGLRPERDHSRSRMTLSPKFHPRGTLDVPEEGTFEELPLSELAESLVRVDGIPLLLQGVKYKDVLRVKRVEEGWFELVAVAEKSRWVSFNVVLSRADVEGPILKQFTSRLSGLGCQWDRVMGGLLLVAVPPELALDPNQVLAALERPLQ